MKIKLVKGRFYAGKKMYKAGDEIPDSPGARKLIANKKAVEMTQDEKHASSGQNKTPREYAAKTNKELVELLKVRGVEIPKGTKTRDEFIALLKKWDAEHGPDGEVS